MGIKELKAFECSRYDLEELIFLSMLADGFIAKCIDVDATVPVWLREVSANIHAEIKARRRREKLRDLERLRQQQWEVTPASERRELLTTKIAALEESLNE